MTAADTSPAALDGRISLSRHADLKQRHTGAILVLPEQAIRLQGSGAEILALCDGTRDRDAILASLEARYPDTPELPDELDRFLGEMAEMGGIECGPTRGAQGAQGAQVPTEARGTDSLGGAGSAGDAS